MPHWAVPRVTVTTALGAEIKFTLRPRNSRPRIVENERVNTSSVDFLDNAPPQQEVQVETVLRSIQAATVTLAPVPEEDEDALHESMMDELTRAPLHRFRVSGLHIPCMTLAQVLHSSFRSQT